MAYSVKTFKPSVFFKVRQEIQQILTFSQTHVSFIFDYVPPHTQTHKRDWFCVSLDQNKPFYFVSLEKFTLRHPTDTKLHSAWPEGKRWDRELFQNLIILPGVWSSSARMQVKPLLVSCDEAQLQGTLPFSPGPQTYKNTSAHRSLHAAGRPACLLQQLLATSTSARWKTCLCVKVFCCCKESAPLIYACQWQKSPRMTPRVQKWHLKSARGG